MYNYNFRLNAEGPITFFNAERKASIWDSEEQSLKFDFIYNHLAKRGGDITTLVKLTLLLPNAHGYTYAHTFLCCTLFYIFVFLG